MTPDQIHLLRKSFARLEPQAQLAALAFYKRLFELAPELRPLFSTSIEEQATKLVEMLALAVNLTDRPGMLEAELSQLGVRHAGYGTKDEHYDLVGRALLDMLSNVLGSEFTPATRAAWSRFYTVMADAMKKGAAVAEVDSTDSVEGAAQSRQVK